MQVIWELWDICADNMYVRVHVQCMYICIYIYIYMCTNLTENLMGQTHNVFPCGIAHPSALSWHPSFWECIPIYLDTLVFGDEFPYTETPCVWERIPKYWDNPIYGNAVLYTGTPQYMAMHYQLQGYRHIWGSIPRHGSYTIVTIWGRGCRCPSIRANTAFN